MTIEDRKRYNSLLNSRGLKFVQSIRLGLNDHHIFFECFLDLLLAKIPEDCLKILDAYLTGSRHADTIWKNQKRLRKMVVWFPPNKQDQGYQEITDPNTLQQLSPTTELHMCLDRNATSENVLARQLLTMMGASLHTMRLQSATSLPSIFSQKNFGLTHLLLEDVTISSLRLQKFPALTHLSLAYCPWSRHGLPTLRQTNIAALVPSGLSPTRRFQYARYLLDEIQWSQVSGRASQLVPDWDRCVPEVGSWYAQVDFGIPQS